MKKITLTCVSFFMECHCSDCFISIERAHCGFIRVEWSPISFSLWPEFPLQCLRITLYKLRGGVWLTQSDSGGLKSPQLYRVLIVPCVNTQCGTPTKEPVMSNCPVPLWGHTGCLCSSVRLCRGLAISPTGVWLKGFRRQGGKHCSHGLPSSRGNRYFMFLLVHTDYLAISGTASSVLGIVLSVEDSVGKQKSAMSTVPMESVLLWRKQVKSIII